MIPPAYYCSFIATIIGMSMLDKHIKHTTLPCFLGDFYFLQGKAYYYYDWVFYLHTVH